MEEVTPEQFKALQRKGHKYRASRVEIDGLSFPSKKQAKRYQDLKLLLSSGEISVSGVIEEFGRWMEVTFGLYGKNGTRVFGYRADFVYDEGGKRVVEDVKGFRPYEYQLKKKLFLDNYPQYEFRET